MIVIETMYLPQWAKIPRLRWHKATEVPARGITDPELKPLINDLDEIIFECAGYKPEVALKEVPVRLVKGESISRHRHREHTVVFYPFGTMDPLRIRIGDDIVPIYPAAGMAIYLPPGTEHGVGIVKSVERCSLAVRRKV